MKMKRKMVKTAIAMITLIAMVIETGFSSVPTFAAVLADDSQDAVIEASEDLISSDTSGDVLTEDSSYSGDELIDDSGSDQDVIGEPNITITHDDIAGTEPADGSSDGKLEVSSQGITGSGYNSVSIYVDTSKLDKKDMFSVKFIGPDSASYNPVFNDKLDKTNGGRYYFDDLNGGEFAIRATSTDNIILSYDYIDGYPAIIVESADSDKVLTTKILTTVDDKKLSAVSGKGYDSIKVKFDTNDLSAKDSFTFMVESDADATVDGKDALDGVEGLTKDSKSLVVENLAGKDFVAYVISDTETELETIAEVTSVEDGTAVIDINGIDSKRVYEYEDSKVYVRATLEKADAIPDDAYFAVAPLSVEEAEKYLEVLNSNKGEDEQEYTSDNTLLYDIGFYKDATKAEEIEPEDGTVSLSVVFKANQVSEDLGITDKENIEVTHFVEEGSNIETETLPVNQLGDVDTVEVETESFSKFAFTGKKDNTVEVDVNTAGAESSKGLLGEAWLYGITANTWKFNGEAETNFAVKTLTGKNGSLNGGQTGVNSDKAQGSTYQYGMVSYVDGHTRIKGFPIELVIPETEISKITHESGADKISIITAAKTDIDNTINSMITYVKGDSNILGSSVRLSRLDSVKSYNNLPNGDDAGKLTIDISKATSGTYYINVDKYPALKNAFTVSEGVTIKKKSDQKLVFNFGGESVELNKFKIVQGGEDYVSDKLANMSTGINPIVEDMIVNMYNAKSAKVCNFAGILLAPKATVEFGGVDGGWLVCDTAISDAEWHFVNGHIPTPKPGKTSIEIPVNKKFIGGSGYWKDDFMFKLVKLSSDGKQVDNSFSPRYITLNGGDSEDASGSFILNYDNVDSLKFGPNYSGFYTNFTECHEEWYRISEENIGKRSDVEYNLYDASDNYGANSPYWFVHVFIYRLSYDHSQVRAVFRTARKDPKTYDWGLGIPCKESQPVFFKNKYRPVETEVELKGIKKINGSDKDIPDGKFAFSLYQYTNRNTGFNSAIQTDVYNQGNEINFAPITLKLGTGTKNEPSKENATKSIWYFLIKETQCAEPYKMDESQFIAKVTVENINNRLVKTVQYFKFEKGQTIDVTRAMENDPAFEFNCSKFKFNNTYDATGTRVIYGFKTLEGRDLEPNDEFTFTLSSTDDTQANANQTKTFKVSQVISNGFSFAFDELSYSLKDAGKEYHYVVKEEAGNEAGMSYDSSSKPVTITVTDTGAGELAFTQEGGTEGQPVKFTNRYGVSSNVIFKARKEYAKRTKLSTQAWFTFSLKGSREDGYKAVDEEKSVQGPNEVVFSEIKFNKTKDPANAGKNIDETGTYHYAIKEVIPDGAKDIEGVPHKKIKDGIIYDDRTYNITLVVTDDKSGELKKSMTGGYDDEVQVAITDVCPEFINDYTVTPAKDSIKGTKSFPGEVLKRGMFTFELSAYDTFTDSAITAGAVVLPATKVKNGIPENELGINDFKFGDITFNREGTYKFLVTECTDDAIPDVEYSKARFVVTEVVEDNGSGELVVNTDKSFATMVGKNEPVNIRFINTPYGNTKLRAYKQLIGKKLAAHQFTFELLDGDTVIDTADNDESGIALFTKGLEYKLSDLDGKDSKVFTYTIKELIPKNAQKKEIGGKTVYVLDGYTYDGHVETVHVTVEKKVDEKNNVYLSVDADNGTEVNQAWFKNEYEAYGKVDLDGTKAITGRKFEKEDNGVWQAVLYDSTGKEIQRADITKETAIWGDNGAAFNFKSLEFKTKAELDPTQTGYVYDDYTTPKTFTYYVKEERNSNPTDTSRTNGMTDDKVVYNVKITVSDDGKGNLIIPDPELTRDDGSAVESMHFDNTFMADNTEIIEAYKKVTGTALEDKMFVFKLTDEQTHKEYTETNDAGGKVSFKNTKTDKYLTYDQDDVRDEPYEYTIKEYVKNAIDGWTYSKAEYVVRIWVSLNENQEIELEKKYFRKNADGTETEVDSAEVVFENTYEATGKVKPWAEKEFTDQDIPANTFWFVLTNEDGTYKDRKPAPATPAGKTAIAEFDEIEYTLDDLKATDTYKVGENTYAKYYFVSEEIPDGAIDLGNGYFKKDGITYDGREYKITVTLTDTKKGKIETDWKAARPNEPYKRLTLWESFKKIVKWDDVEKHALFINTYDADAAIDFNAFKILVGKELEPDKFDFTLSGKDTKGADFKVTKTNSADGTVKFDRIKYTLDDVGDYEYKIVEEIPDGAVKDDNTGLYVKDGIWYDNTEYTVNVSVTDTKLGYLAIDVKVGGNPLTTLLEVETDGTRVVKFDPTSFTFKNEYKPSPVVVTPGGKKSFQGGLLEDGIFEFNMTSDEGSKKPYSDSVRNKGELFTFKPITFTAKDMEEGQGYAKERDFAYTMTETLEKRPGVTYSTAVYKFVIRVTDNNGVLSAEVIRNDSNFKGTVPQSDIATFVNYYNAEGSTSYYVHKIVQGTQTDKEFKFVLTDEQTGKKYEQYCKADETKLIAGFNYDLKDLEKDSAGKYIPRVYKYNVHEEVPAADGEGWEYCRDIYTSTVTVSDDGTGKLKVDRDDKVNGQVYTAEAFDFINKYTAKGDTELKGRKEFKNGELKAGDFSFILEKYLGTENGEAKYEEVATVSNDANGNFSFGKFSYTMDDINKVFRYRVHEDTSKLADDIIPDGTVYDVAISVTDNKDGTLNVKQLVTNGTTVVDDCIFKYVNTKVLPNSIDIDAEKVLIGRPLEDNEFTFTLKGTDGTEVSVKNNGTKVHFPTIQYDLKDADKTYTYTVREEIDNTKKGIKFDENVKTVEVKISLVDGKLVIDRKNTDFDGSQINDDAIKFINYYTAEVKVPLGGSKLLSGFPDDAPSIGQYPYTFALYKSNDLVNALQTVSVTPKDSSTPVEYKFDDLVFTEKDYNDTNNPQHIFEYTVKEVIPTYEKDKAPNVTYATNEYNLVVKLNMDNDHVLYADAVTKQGAPLNELNFTNTYKADGTMDFPAEKTITGKELENAAYTFTLSGNGISQTKTNSGSQINFDPIKYTAQDIGKTYTYTIRETASKDGSTIDTRVYYAEVTVSEGTNGKVIPKKQIYYLDDAGNRVVVDSIKFENTYKASGEVKIDGIKIMHSKPLAAGDFTFILKDENGKEIERVTHGAASLNNKEELEARAAFEFSPLKFTQEDLKLASGYLSELKKYYTVEEQIGNKGGVTYSNAAYVVEVTIKDNGDGTLTVTKDVAGQNDVKKDETGKGISAFLKALIGRMNGKKDQIVFENEYDSECVIDPPILMKQMFGKELERGMFKFEITGPGLRSRNESEYKYETYNGYSDYDTKNTLFPWGKEMAVGEIFPGDIKYKFIDLDIDLTTGEASREFVYHAKEVPGDDKSTEYSAQEFVLTFKAIDDNNGHIYTIPAMEDMKWVPLTPFALSDEQMNDTFINTRPAEGSIDLVGIKSLIGRKLNKDDKFEFTLTDDATGATVTRTNTEDENGIPRIVAFNATDKDGNVDIDFLNYKVDLEEVNPGNTISANFIPVDDKGTHTYTVTEKTTDKAGIKCDTATFKIYVDVKEAKDANGKPIYLKNGHVKLDADVTKVEKIYSDNNKVAFDFNKSSQFEFVNEFKATGKIDFEGSKVIKKVNAEGAKKKEDSLKDKYSFALYQYDDASRTTGKRLVDIKSTDANGKFKLEGPEFDQEALKNAKGEYEESKDFFYRIIETKPANGSWTQDNSVFESDGIIYDNTEYDVDVKVTYDGTTALKITKEIKKAATGEAVSGVVFTNIEVGTAEYTSVSGNKIWIDGVKDPAQRPDVYVDLYSSAVNSGKTVINTYKIKAPATTYSFTKDSAGNELPLYDENEKKITYSVKERTLNGYLSEQKGFDFYNTKGTVKIQKLDAETGEPLAGASLAIYDGKTLVEKWVSADSAHVVEAVLTPGKTYTLRETAAPEGYELAGDISFTVPADGSDITVTMTDKPIIGSVRLTKLDSDTRKTLSGAEFSLYTDAGTRIYATGTAGKYSVTSSTSNGVFATNSSGTLEITDLPKGTYYFVETKAPEGYVLSSEKIRFTISDSSKLVEVTFLNKESVAAVKLRKVGSSGTRGLEGAKFELYAKTPRTSGQAITSTIFPDGYYRYGTYTTNSSGEIRVDDLPWDDYYFVEVQAPDGYEISKDIGGETLVYTFSVDAANAGSTIDLGDITNNPVETGVLGERVPTEEKVSGVLGVRSAPKKGVLGARTGPATGDASAIALWITLLVACIGTIIWMLASRKRSLSKQ